MLTTVQYQAIKAAILADAALAAQPNNPDGNTLVAAALNATAVPDFWVWRTSVSRAEIYHETSLDGTIWSWTIYKNQSAVEQNAWVQMFMGDAANFSKANMRGGIDAIFTAGAAVNATHAKAIGRRKAARVEKLLATGSGTALAPAVMGFEGALTFQDVEFARNML